MELIYLDKYLNDLDKLSEITKYELASTIGMFDGMHLAHQALIKQVVKVSNELGRKSSAITFVLHPDYVLEKRTNRGYLLEFSEKVKKFSELGLDYLFVFTFTKEFSQITSNKFEEIMEKLNIKTLVLGKDSKYGYKALGNIDTLKKKFEVIEFSDYLIDGIPLHSKRIRLLFEAGKVEVANRYLGYNFYVIGKVQRGNQLGRTFETKTANIDLNNNYNYLIKGVYGAYIYYKGNKYLGVCNVGNNPSFNYTEYKKLEVFIFDFNEDIYDEEIKVELITFIREERTFSSIIALKEQIEKDVIYYKNYLGGLNK